MLNFKNEYFTLEKGRIKYPTQFKDKSFLVVYGSKEGGVTGTELTAHIYKIPENYYEINAGQLDFSNYPNGIENDFLTIRVTNLDSLFSLPLNFTDWKDISPENLTTTFEKIGVSILDIQKRLSEVAVYIDSGKPDQINLPKLPVGCTWYKDQDDNIVALPISDLYSKFNIMIEHLKKILEEYATERGLLSKGIIHEIHQPNHGFIFEPITYDNGVWRKADISTSADGMGVIKDNDKFYFVEAGEIEIPKDALDKDGQEILEDEYYYLNENGVGLQREEPLYYYQPILHTRRVKNKLVADVNIETMEDLRSQVVDSDTIHEHGLATLNDIPQTFDTIARLQKSFWLREGQVVEVLGYYEAGDGAGHKRIIKAEDDGSGVLLSNGLYANIMHNGIVHSNWYGISNEMDITSFLKKVCCDNIIQNIIINKGNYKVGGTFRILNNKTINGEDEVILTLNRHLNIHLGTYEFGDVKNVSIKNLTFKNENENKNHVWITFMNGEDLLFENLIFEKVCSSNSHSIDMCGGSNIRIKNCKFLGKFLSDSNDDYREYIQFDNSYGTPAVPGAYSETANYTERSNENVLIDNCIFSYNGIETSQTVCIGSHLSYRNLHKNIMITNNKFFLKNNTKGIRLVSCDGVIIKNNYFEDNGSSVATDVIDISSYKATTSNGVVEEYPCCKNILIESNTFKNIGKHSKNVRTITSTAYSNFGEKEVFSNIKILNNTLISEQEEKDNHILIFLNSAHNIIIFGNTIITSDRRALHLLGCKKIKIFNNYATITENGVLNISTDQYSFNNKLEDVIVENNIFKNYKNLSEKLNSAFILSDSTNNIIKNNICEGEIYLKNITKSIIVNNISKNVIQLGDINKDNIVI